MGIAWVQLGGQFLGSLLVVVGVGIISKVSAEGQGWEDKCSWAGAAKALLCSLFLSPLDFAQPLSIWLFHGLTLQQHLNPFTVLDTM